MYVVYQDDPHQISVVEQFGRVSETKSVSQHIEEIHPKRPDLYLCSVKNDNLDEPGRAEILSQARQYSAARVLCLSHHDNGVSVWFSPLDASFEPSTFSAANTDEAVRKALDLIARRGAWSEADQRAFTAVRSKVSSDLHSAMTETSFAVEHEGILLEGLFKPRLGAKKLLVFFNGAINLKMTGGRTTFQRSTWSEDYDAHCLYLADPTTSTFRNLALGWGVGSRAVWGVPALVGAIEGVLDALSIGSDRVVLFGSSAGGFQAMAVHAFLRSAHCGVNNPQMDWLIYEVPSQITGLVKTVFPDLALADVRRDYSVRAALPAIWGRTGGIPSHLNIRSNLASIHDKEDQMRRLLDAVGALLSDTRFVSIECSYYCDVEFGHSPQRREEASAWLNEILSRCQ